jgi:hypothetical protein
MYSLTIYFVDLELNDIQKKIVDEFIENSKKKYQGTFHIYTVFDKSFMANTVKSDISLIVSERYMELPYKDNQYLLKFYTISGLENDLNELFEKFETEIKELEAPYIAPVHTEYAPYKPTSTHQIQEFDLKGAIKAIFGEYIKGATKDELEEFAMKYHSFQFLSMIEQLYKSRIDKDTLDNISAHIDEIDLDELTQIFEAKEKMRSYGNISVGCDEIMSIVNKIKPIDQSAKKEVGKMATVSSNIAGIDPFKGLFK